ncbi:MAG: enoyl-CoA hydratase-related protein [Bacteroidia bacterium]|nr:enoyl-CoA hydratase-related protein [Bacteroidia bacterium]
MYQSLLTEKLNQTLVITINRPQVLNALRRSLLEELKEVIAELQQDEEVLGAIITGAGDKAFAAGADIAELSDLSAEEAQEASIFGQGVFFDIENSRKPIIAAVNGFALGGGCELAMACHIRIASENAKFGQPEVNLGLLPGYGGTQRLPKLVGKGRATEMLITGDMISADEAFRMGLVNRLTTRGELLENCLETLRKAYSKSPLAIAHTLSAIQAGYSQTIGYEQEAQCFGKAIASEDGREGTKAFLEKRKAVFTGK